MLRIGGMEKETNGKQNSNWFERKLEEKELKWALENINGKSF